VSFLTDGQRVPQDIELDSVGRLLSRLQGFRIKTDHIEKKFGGKAEDLTA
jgi:flagellar biosynthesis GTPase FlhF